MIMKSCRLLKLLNFAEMPEGKRRKKISFSFCNEQERAYIHCTKYCYLFSCKGCNVVLPSAFITISPYFPLDLVNSNISSPCCFTSIFIIVLPSFFSIYALVYVHTSIEYNISAHIKNNILL